MIDVDIDRGKDICWISQKLQEQTNNVIDNLLLQFTYNRLMYNALYFSIFQELTM